MTWFHVGKESKSPVPKSRVWPFHPTHPHSLRSLCRSLYCVDRQPTNHHIFQILTNMFFRLNLNKIVFSPKSKLEFWCLELIKQQLYHNVNETYNNAGRGTNGQINKSIPSIFSGIVSDIPQANITSRHYRTLYQHLMWDRAWTNWISEAYTVGLGQWLPPYVLYFTLSNTKKLFRHLFWLFILKRKWGNVELSWQCRFILCGYWRLTDLCLNIHT